MTSIPVLAATHLDPGAGRIRLDLPTGLTLAEIVATTLPGASATALDHARVALITASGSVVVPRDQWPRVRPTAGVQVVIRIVPSGDNALRGVLSVVVAITAVALGAAWAPALGATLGIGTTAATALVTIGATMVGQLLINALIPPVKAKTDKTNPSYAINGIRNELRPNGAVPFVLGSMRYAPPFACRPYTEVVGNDLYFRAAFVLGEGQLAISDMRLGETSLDQYDEVQTEVRSGLASDPPITLIHRQIVEDQVGVDLIRPLPRDDMGNVIDGQPTVDTPIVRTTGADASSASIILAWPAGLVRFNDGGDKRSQSVQIRIESRRVDAENWGVFRTITVWGRQTEALYRQIDMAFPSRGRWQIRLTMLTDESDDSKVSQRTQWLALQTIRPEYPLAYAHPLALVALRIKATHQLNGTLDNFNCMASRVCRDWDAATGTWVKRATESPAAAYREVLTHVSNIGAVGDDGLDLDQIEDWAAFCKTKGLTYNRILEGTDTTLRDVLTEIAAAGRATPRHDGRAWGVVIDRPTADALIVDHVTPRNSWDFKWSRSYPTPPHAFVVTFLDAANDYKETQRVIRWPGYTGEITRTEDLQLPGKVYAAEVWREARRRQLETIHRPDSYQATQEGSVRVVTRGDAVAVSHYVLSKVQTAARVRGVRGPVVMLDTLVTIEDGVAYAIRWRRGVNDDNPVGWSAVRTVSAEPGETTVLIVDDPSVMPSADDLVMIGPVDHLTYTQIVNAIEVTEDQCQILRLVDAAPQIDTILDATEIPAWSSRVGAEIDLDAVQPSAPRFALITSGVSGTDTAGLVSYLIEPGSGQVRTSEYRVQHRLASVSSWTSILIAAAEGGGVLSDYATGDQIQMRACGIGADGVEGPYTPIIALTVGRGDVAIPDQIDDADITVTTLLGGARIAVAVPTGVTGLQLYRSTTNTLDREADRTGYRVTVSAGGTATLTVGDTSRENLLSDAGFGSAASWTLGSGWTISGGQAHHAAEASGALSQSVETTAGKWLRSGVKISGRTAGTLTPRLTGGSTNPGTPISANGLMTQRLQAVSGNNAFGLLASDVFDGAVDDAVLYRETTACLAAGTHYLWIEPTNADGVPGPVSGPYTIQVI